MDTKFINIDISDVKKRMTALGSVLSPEQAKQMEYRVIRSAGKKVKGIVSTDVPKEYYIKKSEVARDIRSPRMGGSRAASVSCSIPIVGTRHIIGGNTFPAVGGVAGWTGIKAGRRYKIYARILADSFSEIPESMKRQGGNPPFRNLGARKLNDATYTRAAGTGFPPNNKPIVRVTGLAVPQMPMNLSKEDVQEDIRSYMQKRLDHEFAFIIKKCR